MSRFSTGVSLLSLATLLLLSGCGQLTSEPEAESAVVHRISNFTMIDNGVAGKKSARRDNSVKYKDSSKPNGFASDGATRLIGLALIGADGKTDLELTSESAHAAATSRSSGSVTKVQVKSLDPNGGKSVRWTRNFQGKDLGNLFSFDDLEPGWPLAIQANVSGLARGNTVLRFEETVKMRPNLTTSITAPDEAKVDQLFDVVVTVRELNGDVGAHTDCVLYAGATEVSRANGIWVDRGDAVTCFLTTSLSQAGQYELTVVAESVRPGDFDTADNASTTSIEIVEEDAGFWWSASAYANKYTMEQSYRRQYNSHSYGYQSFNVFGYNDARPMQFPMDVDLNVQSGPHVWHEASLQALGATTSFVMGPYQFHCLDHAERTTSGWSMLRICSNSGAGGTRNEFSYSHNASHTLYFAQNLGGGYYYESGHAMPENDGEGVSFEVTLRASNSSAQIEGFLPLTMHSSTSTHDYGGRGSNYYRTTYEGFSGFASGSPE